MRPNLLQNSTSVDLVFGKSGLNMKWTINSGRVIEWAPRPSNFKTADHQQK